MPLLIMMLLLGLFAAIWGFLACFFPVRWRQLVDFFSFGADWSVLSSPPKFLTKTVNGISRAAGFIIFLVGCWFVYMASSLIYSELTGRAMTHR